MCDCMATRATSPLRERIALRRRFGDERVDLGEFAFRNGGGGHPGASVVHGKRCDLFELSGIDSTNFPRYVARFHEQLESFVLGGEPDR